MSSSKIGSRWAASGLIAGLALAVAAPASAQSKSEDVTEFVTAEQVQKKAEEEKLDATLSTAASVSLTSNEDVVGEIDGFSTLFSLGVTGGLEYMEGEHLWQNTLTINESWARTPSLERFVKSNDDVALESLYNYFLLDWLGPFARVNLESALFDTTIVTAEANDYVITRNDGTTETRTGVTELELSSSLEPLTLTQSVGVFAEPVRDDTLSWKVRLGVGGRETFADGVLAVQDDDSTDPIEVVELSNVYQGGLEGFTGIEGELEGGKFTYRAGASALLPVVNNDPEDRGAFELMRWGLHAGLEMAVVEWMAVNYKLDVLKDPQLLDATQVQNNLLLTFKYTLIEPDKGPEPTPAEKASKLRKEAAEAEAKAAKLREEAAALEETTEQEPAAAPQEGGAEEPSEQPSEEGGQ